MLNYKNEAIFAVEHYGYRYLLLRKNVEGGTFIDITFSHVLYMDITFAFKGVFVRTATEEERKQIFERLGAVVYLQFMQRSRLFVIESEGRLNYVVADGVSISANNIPMEETIGFSVPRLELENWENKHKEYYRNLDWFRGDTDFFNEEDLKK